MTFITRRHATLGLLSLAAGLPAITRAQPRPELLRVVCGYPPGGGGAAAGFEGGGVGSPGTDLSSLKSWA